MKSKFIPTQEPKKTQFVLLCISSSFHHEFFVTGAWRETALSGTYEYLSEVRGFLSAFLVGGSSVRKGQLRDKMRISNFCIC